MIKHSFGQDKEYVVVKEDEYEDSTSTSKDTCRAYQEIFRMIDERWMDLAAKKSTMLVKYLKSGNLEVLESEILRRPLGGYDLGVATPRALVYAGVMTSEDARSWYMISGDAKSWSFE
ncbi:hypothetical protein Tco_0561217 [Tanacetum coccineum]